MDDDIAVVCTEDASNIPDVRACLFRVVYKLSYNVRKELRRREREGREANTSWSEYEV